MKEKFKDQKFTPETMAIIERADRIIASYAQQGYDLSVRQLYYQFVARNWIANRDEEYKRLASIISDARMAGLIDWDAIKDRGRVTREGATHRNIAEFLQALNQQYRRDKWSQQPRHISVMVEKQALEGVLLPICQKWEIAFTANKGYSSSSTMYERGKYLQSMRDVEGKDVHVIYLGDHDPSGIDMTRDIEDRLRIFSDGDLTVHRIALNIDQVQQWRLPENPAKLTDSRSGEYISRFGDSSWELDAIAPEELARLVEEKIGQLLDRRAWDQALRQEFKEKNELQDIITSFTEGDQ